MDIQSDPMTQAKFEQPSALSPEPVIPVSSVAAPSKKKITPFVIVIVVAVVVVLAILAVVYVMKKPAPINTNGTPTPTPTESITPTPTPKSVQGPKTITVEGTKETYGNMTMTKQAGWQSFYDGAFINIVKDGVSLFLDGGDMGGVYTQCSAEFQATKITTTITRENYIVTGPSATSADEVCTKGTWIYSVYSGVPNMEEGGLYSISVRRQGDIDTFVQITDANVATLVKEADEMVKSLKITPISTLRDSLIAVTWYGDKAVGSGHDDAIVFRWDGTYVYSVSDSDTKKTYEAEYGNFQLLSNNTVRVTAKYVIRDGKKVAASSTATAVLTFSTFTTEPEARPTPEGAGDEYPTTWKKFTVTGGAFGTTGKTFYDFSYDQEAIQGLSSADLSLFE